MTSGAMMAMAGQKGADLVAHGSAANLSEVLPNGLEGTGLETELDDGHDVVDVQVVHASCAAQLGLDVAQVHRVEEIDVHVVVVLLLVVLSEVGGTA